MISEFLVVLSCSKNLGCTEVASEYYRRNIELQEMVKVTEAKMYTILPPLLTQYGAPILYAAAGGTINVRLYKGLSLYKKVNYSSLQYAISF